MRPTPLSTRFNIAVNHIARRIFPCGFDVSGIAPSTSESLRAHYEKTGRILVWSGASDSTIFADREINYAFRAWHDSKHVLNGFPFTRDGESDAMSAQAADICAIYDGRIAKYFCDILRAEIIGQFDYNESLGGFPIDQIGFVRLYLMDELQALNTNFGMSKDGVG